MIPLKRHEHCSLLVLVERVARVYFLCLIKALESVRRFVAAVVQSHAAVSPQRCELTIDVSRTSEVLVCLYEVLLLVGNVAETPPSVIVPVVHIESILEASLRFFVVFICHEFVARQGVRVGHVRIHLDSLIEVFKRGLVLLLKTVAVADHTHGFGDVSRAF